MRTRRPARRRSPAGRLRIAGPEVRAGTQIRFAPALRISLLRIASVSAGEVGIDFESPTGSGGSTSNAVGGTGGINGVSFRVLDVRGGTAVLEFTPS